MMRWLAAVLAVAVLASCGVEPGAEPTPAPPGEQAVAYLVASPEGVVEVLEDGTVRPVTDTPAAAAYRAGDRVVVQELSEAGRMTGSVRVGTGRGFETSDVLVEPEEDTVFLQLHGVATVNGDPAAVVTEVRGADPDTQVERLAVVDVQTGERRNVADTGGWEDWTSRATLGDDVFVLFAVSGVTSYTTFLSADGEQVEADDDPLPQDCPDDVRCPSNVVTDPDGRHFAWVAAAEQPDGTFVPHVIVSSRADGSEVLRAELPDGFGSAHLELRADRVVVNPWSAHTGPDSDPAPALVFSLAGPGDATTLPAAGYASVV